MGLMVKKGVKTLVTKTRGFLIRNGMLENFKSTSKNARHTRSFDLKALATTDYAYEPRTDANKNTFYGNYNHSVRVLLDGRMKYLYANDKKEAQKWVRAIQLAKHLTNAQDKIALQMCIKRVASSVMDTGWRALFQFYRETALNRELMKTFAMRLIKTELG